MKKIVLAVLLAVCMIAGTCVLFASAETKSFSGGSYYRTNSYSVITSETLRDLVSCESVRIVVKSQSIPTANLAAQTVGADNVDRLCVFYLNGATVKFSTISNYVDVSGTISGDIATITFNVKEPGAVVYQVKLGGFSADLNDSAIYYVNNANLMMRSWCEINGYSTQTIKVIVKKYDSAIRIHNYVPSRTEDYRSSVTFFVANDDIQNPESGEQIHWFINDQDQHTGDSYTVEDAKSTYTVQVKYMKDGKVLAESETETINIKTGFFARLKAFFRKLFGRLPKVVQEYLGIEIIDRMIP